MAVDGTCRHSGSIRPTCGRGAMCWEVRQSEIDRVASVADELTGTEVHERRIPKIER